MTREEEILALYYTLFMYNDDEESQENEENENEEQNNVLNVDDNILDIILNNYINVNENEIDYEKQNNNDDFFYISPNLLQLVQYINTK
jgi:hypothetical protein